jgi:hypothetical protein
MYCMKGSRGGVHELYEAGCSLGTCGNNGHRLVLPAVRDRAGTLLSLLHSLLTDGPELLETWANSGIFIHKLPFTSHLHSSRRLVSSVVHPPMQYMMESSPSSLHSRMC